MLTEKSKKKINKAISALVESLERLGPETIAECMVETMKDEPLRTLACAVMLGNACTEDQAQEIATGIF